MAATIDRHQLIQPGDRIVVGISGGKDSPGLWQLLRYQLVDIRKLLFTREQDFPVTENGCPNAGHSKRKKMKEPIENLDRKNKLCFM